MLKAILYSEFDNVTGPKLVYQHPPRFLSDAVFDSISDYLITTQELCGSIIRVRASGRQVLSYPLRIEDDKYDRNALLFNVLLLLITSVRPTSTPNPHPHTSPRAPHPAPSPSPGLRRAVLHARLRLVRAADGGGLALRRAGREPDGPQLLLPGDGYGRVKVRGGG